MFNSGIDEAGWFQYCSAPKAPGQPRPPFTTDSLANRALFELCYSHPATGDLPSNFLPVFHVHFKFTGVSNYASIPTMCSKTMTKINQDTKNAMALCFTACISVMGKFKIQKACELHKTWLAKSS